MKRRGVEDDPQRIQLVRRVKLLNEVRPMLKSIKGHGEVKQKGMGATWWEKSIVFMSRVREKTAHAVKDTWRKLLEGRRGRDDTNGPQPEM